MTKEEIIEMVMQIGGCDRPEDDSPALKMFVTFAKLVAEKAIKEALAQPKQEPLAWISTGPARMIHWTADKPAYGDDWVPLYTTPPQRKPLTDEDVERIVREARVGEHGIGYTIARAIEAAHNIKEKNLREQK